MSAAIKIKEDQEDDLKTKEDATKDGEARKRSKSPVNPYLVEKYLVSAAEREKVRESLAMFHRSEASLICLNPLEGRQDAYGICEVKTILTLCNRSDGIQVFRLAGG